MTHGFGVSTDELLATELYVVAHNQRYGTAISGDTVTVTNSTGYMLDVAVINGKFAIKVNGKDRTYKTVSSTMKAIERAFDIIIDNNNKRY